MYLVSIWHWWNGLIWRIMERNFGIVWILRRLIKEPKRETDFYFKLLEKFNVIKDEIFVFEDSFYSLDSANKVGIKTCAIKHSINKNKLKNNINNFIFTSCSPFGFIHIKIVINPKIIITPKIGLAKILEIKKVNEIVLNCNNVKL